MLPKRAASSPPVPALISIIAFLLSSGSLGISSFCVFLVKISKDFLRLPSSLSASFLRDVSVSLSLSISWTPSISSSQEFNSLIASIIGTRSECSLDRFNLISIFISLSPTDTLTLVFVGSLPVAIFSLL